MNELEQKCCMRCKGNSFCYKEDCKCHELEQRLVEELKEYWSQSEEGETNERVVDWLLSAFTAIRADERERCIALGKTLKSEVGGDPEGGYDRDQIAFNEGVSAYQKLIKGE